MDAFFSCHPPDSKCEWGDAVRDFALRFNRMRNTHYVRETCFDATSSEEPVPEVRLVAAERAPMVVERKTIQWPEQFLHRHSHWHRLAKFLAGALASLCAEPMTIAINSDCLQRLSKRQVDRVGELIVQQVRAGSKSGVVASFRGEPMPWRIHSGLFSAPEGTKIEVLDWPGQAWPEPDEFLELREAQITGFRNELARRLREVEKKFATFPDHYRVLLLQFVGESSALIEETDLAPIVKIAQEASFVDEVWVATKEWISEDDFEIGWVPSSDST